MEKATLVGLPPELIHMVALSGHLSFNDVGALALTCVRMKSVLIEDGYGNDIRYALLGVEKNARRRRWRSARYAVRRRWWGEGEAVGTVWKVVAECGVMGMDGRRMGAEEVERWEALMMACLSVPNPRGVGEGWWGESKKVSLLIAGVTLGSTRVAEWALERGLDINSTWDGGRYTLLRLAMERRNADMVTFLLDKGAQPKESRTHPLYLAVEKRDVGMVALLAGRMVGALRMRTLERRWSGEKESLLYVAVKKGFSDIVSVLLKSGADVDWGCGTATENDKTPLYAACKVGNVAVVRILLGAGADVNGGSVSPLGAAAQGGKFNCVRALVEGGADVDAVLPNGKTPLYHAVQQWDISKTWKANAIARIGHRPRGLAGRKGWKKRQVEEAQGLTAGVGGWKEMCNILIAAGADIDAESRNGESPLFLACRNGYSEWAQILLNAGADVNKARSSDGATVLDLACEGQHHGLITRLVAAGANTGPLIEWASMGGWHSAVRRGNCNVVNLLLDVGVDIDVARTAGNSWIPDVLTETSSLRLAVEYSRIGVARLLVRRGCDVNAVDGDGFTPLMVLCKKGKMEFAQFLVEAGADVNARSAKGLTPLLIAVKRLHGKYGLFELVQFLVENGSDVNARADDGTTPLTIACGAKGSFELVQFLLENGGDVNAGAEDGTAPLMVAGEREDFEMIKYLLEKGADPRHLSPCVGVLWDDALVSGRVEIIRALLAAGANPNATSRPKFSPLYRVAWDGNVDAVRLLLQAGAAVEGAGRSCPIRAAQRNGFVEVVELLEQAKSGGVEDT